MGHVVEEDLHRIMIVYVLDIPVNSVTQVGHRNINRSNPIYDDTSSLKDKKILLLIAPLLSPFTSFSKLLNFSILKDKNNTTDCSLAITILSCSLDIK